MVQMRVIAFAGPKSCGKDTAAKRLLARNALAGTTIFQQVNFADPLKAACGLIFGFTQNEMFDADLKEVPLNRWPYKTPREVLQNVGQLFRTMYAQDIWVKAWQRRIQATTAACIVVTDLRHEEELDLLKQMGAKIIYVANDRVEALRAKGIAENDPMWTDFSEAFARVMRSQADLEIPNNKDLPELYQHVDQALSRLFGSPSEWSEVTIKAGKSQNL